MPQLPVDLFDDIRRLLIPQMQLKEDRVALLTPVLSSLPIYQFIQWDWIAPACAADFIQRASFDELGAVIAALREHVGVDGQTRIHAALEQLREFQARRATATLQPNATNAIFISYARADAEVLAARLYEDMIAAHFTAWRDKRNLDPYKAFDAVIEQAIREAPVMVVIVSPDVQREDSFVRREIAYALEVGTPIIPLKLPGTILPIMINLLTWLPFEDYDRGLHLLLARLRGENGALDTPASTLVNKRSRELAYLQDIGQRFERWLHLYTDLAGRAEKQHDNPLPTGVKTHVLKYLNTENEVYREHGFVESGHGEVVETVNELREVVRQGGVVLIGDPGSGKSTTLQRLAYEFAVEAVEDESKPLPLLVPLGAYSGGGLESHLGNYFGGLPLSEYLPGRVILLLDGLNEMPQEHVLEVERWLLEHRQTLSVVTCRKLDYAALKALPLRRVDVAPLDITRIRAFIGNVLEDDYRDRLFWGLAGTDSLWQLDKSKGLPGLLGLVSNPFLLSITIEVFIPTLELPRNRGQLLDSFVDLLLEKRARLAKDDLRRERVRAALAQLAYRMQAEKTGTSVPTTWAREILGDDLLYLAESATILTADVAQGEVKFFHQLLQEYCAVSGLRAAIRQGVSARTYFPSEQWWEPTGWEETVVLLAGLEDDATEIVRWLMPVQPDLAYRCVLKSGAACASEVQQALIDLKPPARLNPLPRIAWGERLNEQPGGDRRKGVGLIPSGQPGEGLPDIDWVVIPAGLFFYQDEPIPRYLPTYHIARYPMTYTQFDAFLMASDGFYNPTWWEGLALDDEHRTQPGEQWRKYGNHPRQMVSWYDAVAFTRWLSAKLGYDIRLPTEWEWEKAARGIQFWRQYPWGKNYIPGYANINETLKSVGPYDVGGTTPVGMYLQGASPYGVLDMSGNGWEWCLNEYRNPERVETTGSAPRMLRGGSWRDLKDFARTVSRDINSPYVRSFNLGFRLACSSPIF